MMLANDELRVVLVTIHMSLRRAIDALSIEGIAETLAITHAAGLRFGMRPRASPSPGSIRTRARAAVRRRGDPPRRAGDRAGARGRHRCARPVRAGHGLHARRDAAGKRASSISSSR